MAPSTRKRPVHWGSWVLPTTMRENLPWAAPLLRDGMRIGMKLGGEEAEHASTRRTYLVNADIQIGQLAEAEDLALAAIDALETGLTSRSPVTGLELIPTYLAEISGRTGHRERFEQRLKQILDTVEARVGKDDPALARALWLVAEIYRRSHAPDRAQQFALRVGDPAPAAGPGQISRWPTRYKVWEAPQRTSRSTPRPSPTTWNACKSAASNCENRTPPLPVVCVTWASPISAWGVTRKPRPRCVKPGPSVRRPATRDSRKPTLPWAISDVSICTCDNNVQAGAV